MFPLGAHADAHAGQILSLSVYVESQSSPEMPFGSRARTYPGPAGAQQCRPKVLERVDD